MQRGAALSLTPAFLILTFVTGIVDAVSVLGLDRVFVANMTGNVAFLGFAAVGTPGFHIAPLLAALLAFLLGALIAGRSLARQAGSGQQARSFVFEGLLLAAAGVVALEYDPAAPAREVGLYAIIGLTGIAMGYRNARIRALKVPDMTTTVLTLTLTGLAAESSAAGGTNPNWQTRVGSVIALALGAALGAVLVLHSGLALPLLVGAGLVLVAELASARTTDAD